MSLVQTIVIKPSTHFDTIAAAALASGAALAHADLDCEPWASWLSGSFTKSVRRVKRPVELERIRALGLPRAEVTVGDAVGIAFAPARYEDSPREISRLQVSGLDIAHNDVVRFRMPGAFTPHIEINADVSMTTGKTAAQVAHALCAGLLAQSLNTRSAWASNPGLDISEVSFAAPVEQREHVGRQEILIRDNGLTEIAPGTATVRVYIDQLA
ncbi:peptidyl-tRNA hydrolase [Cryobacterium sp. 5B3]|uniref:peptidyl-tRNA hydrolase n=1 Tax=Cryobacterium sp. 5B3 TaxID=3048586 RepID=UPI002AB33296|nr:peptidyl-tRNA hydrolase [Cryobacterium sp. 5B3]MDY7541777.1 peptidyl-tRNA hydrolase [Cryobacterium sp. 5B3]MEB0275243.1 peptidyl-tRNA hydrolase [Cryobacterium sp. 5B3]